MVAAPGAPGPSPDSQEAASAVPAPEAPAPTASPSREAPAGSEPSPSPPPLQLLPPPPASPGAGRPPLRLVGWGGMAAAEWLGAGLARVLFYPTLLYTVFRGKMPGRGHRDWYHRIDPTVLLGALPLRSMTLQEWKKFGVEQLRLSTVDMTGIPTLANLKKGVQFALKYQALGQCVYVHCKAGRSRSATMVAAYLIQVHKWSPEEAVRAITKIRSHIHIRPGQLQVLKEFHKITSEAAKNETVIHQ
ncbi:phosphatidylglycerophosphatase and protein-tyrosine phosphatase 1 isoform X2 [Oryctolagus cuniculus]|uniref:phosphatidylglycerophosphatase and protein-tyrosine phosphatase 1 isoform X2 n=1 Tax=Oryctolagus cuniculus TaxID=9986 RepID=UPI00222F0DFF|nr:phosphatidylglycerophosphatase and protein-tyrosine phosphatase 1 isoform X2 [Oryctolagus cuniculus]